MFSPHLLATSATMMLPGLVNGFLIPNSLALVPTPEMQAPSALLPNPLISPESQSRQVTLPCPQCTLQDGIVASMMFNISLTPDKKALLFNSSPIYPANMARIIRPEQRSPSVTLSARTATGKAGVDQPKDQSVQIKQWSVDASEMAANDDPKSHLIKLGLQIRTAGDKKVTVPRVDIQLVKDASQNLAIIDTKLSEPEKEGSCDAIPIFCRLRSGLFDKVESFSDRISNMRDSMCSRFGGLFCLDMSDPFSWDEPTFPPLFPDFNLFDEGWGQSSGEKKSDPRILPLSDGEVILTGPTVEIIEIPFGDRSFEAGSPKPQQNRLPETPSSAQDNQSDQTHGAGYYARKAFVYILSPFTIGALAALTAYVICMALGYGIAASLIRLNKMRRPRREEESAFLNRDFDDSASTISFISKSDQKLEESADEEKLEVTTPLMGGNHQEVDC